MMFRCADIRTSYIDGNSPSMAIYFQGCTLGCKGCQNPELQSLDGGYLENTDVIIKILEKNKDFYKGVVFSGGDPMDQEEALFDLLNRIDLHKTLYTGRYIKDIPASILEHVDCVVDGPFDVNQFVNGAFPASQNQRIWNRVGKRFESNDDLF